ncbi:formylglycine-generating enzyme family protein [Epibacterium ulvae]|uniref:formylglycine-generating enzyme family protein n=1 Tax=Epibacterium ulvae TaxID=1156985 RepID=UPI0024930B5D|nr:formylglycine-generating enzyme family protein [Epibacterium ulvae]
MPLARKIVPQDRATAQRRTTKSVYFMSDTIAKSSCCTPARGGPDLPPVSITRNADVAARLRAQACAIPGGTALVGCRKEIIPGDGEAPLRKSRIKPFRMTATTVTNAEFQAFIEATGYITEAERIGWSFVFWQNVPPEVGPTQGILNAEWWRRVDGANWRDINGPDTEKTVWQPDHPAVQLSWNDARAYCDWVGGRLPSEAEWEHAARGGLGEVRYPWGDEEPDDGAYLPCNIWQGDFPHHNTGADGYLATAPAKSYAPNGYGLYNLVGNVWEWIADPYQVKSLKKDVRARLSTMKGYKLSKGGSYLCHKSYCYRYRIAARSGNSPDSATPHQGFRVIWPERS